MSKSNPHGQIIAAVAKAALTPLGFQRKGASRIWLADHGFWLDVVEFQPSGFSKGTYCSVGVHWLWGMTPATFDYGFERVGSFAQFGSADAFSESVTAMARAAVKSVERHRSIFVSLPATAAHLARAELSETAPRGWDSFHAGIACGLTQEDGLARRMFDRVIASDDLNIEWVNQRRSIVDRLIKLLSDRVAFRSEVQALISAQRRQFKLLPFALSD